MNDEKHSSVNDAGAIELERVTVPKSKKTGWSKHLFTFIKITLVAATFYYIYRYLHSNWGQLRSLNIHIDYVYVILAFIVLKMGWLVSCWAWGKTLEAFGHKLSYRSIYIIYFRSMLAKYLPGKVWQLAGSTYIALKMGISEGANIASFITGQAYSVLSGVVLVMAAVSFGIIKKSGGGVLPLRWTAIPILAAIIVLVVRPGLFARVMNVILPLFKREKITVNIKITTSLFLFLAYIVPWLLFGLAFWLLASALTSVPFDLYIPLTIIFTAGTVIGFLAVFSPGGIGVREASIAALAASTTSFPAAFALALGLGYRIVTSIIEVIAFGITWLIKGSKS
jgi:uncharacterized membrane protein YbhN (UPF0104 family)